MRNLTRIAGALVGLALLNGGPGEAVAQGLPGGASSLNETHGDWTVTCTADDGSVRCVMSQTLVSRENGQRVLSAQFGSVSGEATSDGVLVLPFGLRLDAGVQLFIDEDALSPVRRFSTCLPAGCVLPLALDADTLTALSAGTTLGVTATANDSEQEVAFTLSLTGFGSALARIAQLDGA